MQLFAKIFKAALTHTHILSMLTIVSVMCLSCLLLLFVFSIAVIMPLFLCCLLLFSCLVLCVYSYCALVLYSSAYCNVYYYACMLTFVPVVFTVYLHVFSNGLALSLLTCLPGRQQQRPRRSSLPWRSSENVLQVWHRRTQSWAKKY